MWAATPTLLTDKGDSALGPTVTARQIAHWNPDRRASDSLVAGLKSSRLPLDAILLPCRQLGLPINSATSEVLLTNTHHVRMFHFESQRQSHTQQFRCIQKFRKDLQK
jgi:hypothetical protein